MGLTKRYAGEYYSDRYAASFSDISTETYFDTPTGVTGPESRSILAYVGTTTSPASTGISSITGVGFESKAIIPFGVGVSSDSSTTGAMLGFGAGVSSVSRGTISISSVDGAISGTHTDRRHDDTNIFTILDSGVVYEEADLESVNSDGFQLDWDTVGSSANILNYISLGGNDLEASLTLHTMNGDGSDDSFAHGLIGGEPSALLIFASPTSNSLPVTNTQGKMTIGAWAGGNQFSAAINTRDNVATSDCSRILSTGQIFTFLNNGGTVSRTFTIDSVNSTGVNITELVGSNTTQWQFNMLALRGCKAQVGTFDVDTTDPYTISCSGITPKLFLPIFLYNGVANLESSENDLYITIGAYDGTNSVSCGITDDHSQTTTEANRVQSSDSFEEISASNGGSLSESTAAFDGESVVITATNVGNANQQGGYLIIGN